MKYLVLAVLLFACGAGLTQLRVEDEQAYVPVVRTRTTEGLFLTLLHERVKDRRACQQTVDRFAGLLRRVDEARVLDDVVELVLVVRVHRLANGLIVTAEHREELRADAFKRVPEWFAR